MYLLSYSHEPKSPEALKKTSKYVYSDLQH
jgi:hypothetical protein